MKGASLALLVAVLASGTVIAQEGSGQTRQEARIESGQDQIEITAYWAPFSRSKYGFGERWETVRNLKPAEVTKLYSAEELAFFLPPEDARQGEIHELDLEKFISVIRQLHGGATHHLHHGGPIGGFVCVAAENDTWRRIRTRAHAEFNLKDGVYLPSQFAGDIIIERATGKIIAFKLAVPPRQSNVDLNWERETDDGEVWVDKDGKAIEVPKVQRIADIGFCERLELIGGDWSQVDDIQWDTELTFREVDTLFQKKFYRFAQIDWLPWEEAVAMSRETGKPLHVVALFGVLDDESC